MAFRKQNGLQPHWKIRSPQRGALSDARTQAVFAAIHRVPYDRMPNACEVDADLACDRFWMYLQ